MPSRWVPNTEGEQALLRQLAAGADNFGEYAVERIKAIERGLEHSSRHRAGRRYVDTIRQATYLNGALVGGTDVAGAARPRGDTIHSRVYTTSFLGHMLEITGARPHDILISVGQAHGPFAQQAITIHHPGFTRRPHFVPGVLSAMTEIGTKFRGKARVETF